MTEYAFLKHNPILAVRLGELHNALAGVLPEGTLEAVTLAGHTRPPVVFVRCARELDDEEFQAVKGAVENYNPLA